MGATRAATLGLGPPCKRLHRVSPRPHTPPGPGAPRCWPPSLPSSRSLRSPCAPSPSRAPPPSAHPSLRRPRLSSEAAHRPTFPPGPRAHLALPREEPPPNPSHMRAGLSGTPCSAPPPPSSRPHSRRRQARSAPHAGLGCPPPNYTSRQAPRQAASHWQASRGRTTFPESLWAQPAAGHPESRHCGRESAPLARG